MVPPLSEFSLNAVKYVHGELGFLFTISIFKYLEVNDYVFMFTLSVISILTKAYFFLRTSDNPVFCFAIYIAAMSLTFEFVQIRYALSMSFIFLSFLAFQERRFKWFFVFSLFAASLHYFAVLGVIFVLLSGFHFNRLILFFLAIIIYYISSMFPFNDIVSYFVSYYGDGSSLGRRVRGYTSGEDNFSASVNFFSIVSLRIYLVYFALIVFDKFYALKGRYDGPIFGFISTSILFLSFFSFNAIIFSRAAAVIEVFIFVLLSNALFKLKPLCYRVAICIFLLLFYVLFFVGGVSSESIYMYQTWFSEII